MGEYEIIIQLANEEVKRGVCHIQASKNAIIQFNIALKDSLNFEFTEKKKRHLKNKAKSIIAKEEAKKKAIENNLGLVYKIAIDKYRFTKKLDLFDDVINEGVLGLIRAYDLYDPSQRKEFSTYAYTWIWCYMDKFVKRYIENRKGSSLKYKEDIPLSLNVELKGNYESNETLQDILVGENDVVSDDEIIVNEFVEYSKTKGKYELVKNRIDGMTFKEIAEGKGVTFQALNMVYTRLEREFTEKYKRWLND